jgi:hypothetical protein
VFDPLGELALDEPLGPQGRSPPKRPPRHVGTVVVVVVVLLLVGGAVVVVGLVLGGAVVVVLVGAVAGALEAPVVAGAAVAPGSPGMLASPCPSSWAGVGTGGVVPELSASRTDGISLTIGSKYDDAGLPHVASVWSTVAESPVA